MNKLAEGDVIMISPRHTVYALVPKHFVYANKRGCWELTKHNVTVMDEFLYLSGEYIVTKAVMDGGGTGNGPGDIYPDGWHVFCQKEDDPSIKIDFYQSGCFTAMIEDIKPIGRAVANWTTDRR
jgi:hypothetical protein